MQILIDSSKHAGLYCTVIEGKKRIGVAFTGDPENPTSWSGSTLGVINGLRECGVEAVPINVRPGSRFVRAARLGVFSIPYLRSNWNLQTMAERALQGAALSPSVGTLDAWTGWNVLSRTKRLHGVIQIGCSYRLATDLPVATFEDITVKQARANGYPGWELVSPNALRRRISTQQRVYGQAVACCLMTAWAAQSVIDDYGIDPNKVHVVGVGRNHSASTGMARDWNNPRFLFVGSDWNWKNGDAVIRAFGRLRRDFPAARLDLVGPHPRTFHEGVTGYGVLRLDMPEHRATLDRLFAAATCLAVPSRIDAAGIVYVEASAAGIPSICTTAGGSPFLVGDGGVAVDPGDEAALLATMQRLSNPDFAASVGAAAQRRSVLFTWRAVAQRLIRALEGGKSRSVDMEFASPLGL